MTIPSDSELLELLNELDRVPADAWNAAASAAASGKTPNGWKNCLSFKMTAAAKPATKSTRGKKA